VNPNTIPAINTRIETNSPVVRFTGKAVIKREANTGLCIDCTFITQPVAFQSIGKLIVSNILPRLSSKWGQHNPSGLQVYFLFSYFKFGVTSGLDGREFEPRQGQDIRIFSKRSTPALGPTQLPIPWAPGLFPWDKAAKTWR
jgi:hypothetical protein